MNNEKNPWQTISSREVYENHWIKLEEDQIINPNGGQGIYGRIHFKMKALAVIPIDTEGYTWLVGQYRYTLNAYSWEIPMGGHPVDEDPREGARRELKEETGLTAENLKLIMKLHTSNSVTDEEGYIYLANQLNQGETDFDETEKLDIKKLPFSEALNMVMDGSITDSLSVAGILKAARMLQY